MFISNVVLLRFPRYALGMHGASPPIGEFADEKSSAIYVLFPTNNTLICASGTDGRWAHRPAPIPVIFGLITGPWLYGPFEGQK